MHGAADAGPRAEAEAVYRSLAPTADAAASEIERAIVAWYAGERLRPVFTDGVGLTPLGERAARLIEGAHRDGVDLQGVDRRLRDGIEALRHPPEFQWPSFVLADDRHLTELVSGALAPPLGGAVRLAQLVRRLGPSRIREETANAAREQLAQRFRLAAETEYALAHVVMYQAELRVLGEDSVPLEVMAADREAERFNRRQRRRIRRGQVEPAAVDHVLSWRRETLASLMPRLAAPASADAVMRDIEPRSPHYEPLIDVLARYEAIVESGGWWTLAGDEELRLGDEGGLVLALRNRLAAEGYVSEAEDEDVFDTGLRDTLQRWQVDRQLIPTGTVDEYTRAALDVSAPERLAQVMIAMRRLRHSPVPATGDYIRVNIPQFVGEYRADGELLHEWRSVVGKVRGNGSNFTPELRTQIGVLEFNPYWYPPNRLGGLRDDGQRRVVGPGPWNPMGQVKFVLPNTSAIYLHDTNDPEWFRETWRAESHGCVRVDNALDLAAVIVSRDRGWEMERAEAWIEEVIDDGATVRWEPEGVIPVFFEYITVWVDGDRVRFGTDLYRWDTDESEAILRELDHTGRATITESRYTRAARLRTLSRRRHDVEFGGYD